MECPESDGARPTFYSLLPVMPEPISADALSEHSAATELDIYAAEFAKLVDRFVPSRCEQPSDWLATLPDEALHYYSHGISTFGRGARTPIERRGRLYLIHTALVFMWMSWGKTTARHRFQEQADRGTRRAAFLVTLESYRRGDVLAEYKVSDWFYQPVGEWTVRILSTSVRLEAVPDSNLRSTLQKKNSAQCEVSTLSTLRSVEAIPSRSALAFG